MSEAWKYTTSLEPGAIKHMKKFEELFDALKHNFMVKADDLIKSGAINLPDYNTEEYILAKILITAILNDQKNCYAPLLDEHRAEVKNLKHF